MAAIASSSQWETDPASNLGGGDFSNLQISDNNGFGDTSLSCVACGGPGHQSDNCPNTMDAGASGDHGDEKCFGCGETGHRRSECPTAGPVVCHNCKQEGHMIKNCPDKPPMICENCGEEGHMKRSCVNARRVNRDHVADVDAPVAWEKIKQATNERDVDDVKEAIQEYVKALGGVTTFAEIQEGLIRDGIGLWLIAMEKEILPVFTNMDLQGNMGKKYTISYRFSDKPERPREKEAWPKDREELLNRLADAGDVVNTGLSRCLNCSELGHVAKACPEEKVERTDRVKISCYNCGADGHRVRDCPEPRVDKNACRNCGQAGHRASDCEEPPNMDNVECRKCNEMGHFAKDCPQGGGRACRNCGQEGHIAKDCEEPRNMDTVTCRNCDKMGHFSRDCPEPKDWSKVQCSNCQLFGHTKVRCKRPPAESLDGDDGGGRSGGFDNDNGFPSNDADGFAAPSGEQQFTSSGW